LKLVIGLQVGSMHCSLHSEKPFNPILGETFQAQIGASSLFCEQSSHHPPVTHYLLEQSTDRETNQYSAHGWI